MVGLHQLGEERINLIDLAQFLGPLGEQLLLALGHAEELGTLQGHGALGSHRSEQFNMLVEKETGRMVNQRDHTEQVMLAQHGHRRHRAHV